MRIIGLEFLQAITVKLCGWMQSGWRETYSREGGRTWGQGGRSRVWRTLEATRKILTFVTSHRVWSQQWHDLVYFTRISRTDCGWLSLKEQWKKGGLYGTAVTVQEKRNKWSWFGQQCVWGGGGGGWSDSECTLKAKLLGFANSCLLMCGIKERN